MVTKTKTKTTAKKAAVNSSAANTSVSATELKARIEHHLQFTLGEIANEEETKSAHWQATSLALQDIVVAKLKATKVRQLAKDTKSVNYLSLEYLMGRLLSNNLHNVDLYDTAEKALKALGFDLADLCEQGPDLALGNGGLGRLAACFLDSLAPLDYNAMGYVFITNMVYLNKHLLMVIRSKCQICGVNLVTHGKSVVQSQPSSFLFMVMLNKSCKLTVA